MLIFVIQNKRTEKYVKFGTNGRCNYETNPDYARHFKSYNEASNYIKIRKLNRDAFDIRSQIAYQSWSLLKDFDGWNMETSFIFNPDEVVTKEQAKKDQLEHLQKQITEIALLV